MATTTTVGSFRIGNTKRSGRLPQVKLQRSASTPGVRQGDLDIIHGLKAHEGSFGPKGARVASSLRNVLVRDALKDALGQGDLKALKASYRAATSAGLSKDPLVEHVKVVLARVDKCILECKEGIAEDDMISLHCALESLHALQLGPRQWDNPYLARGRELNNGWEPYRPFLLKLQKAIGGGAVCYCEFWIEVVEGALLSAEYEERSSVELARSFPAEAAEALDAALAMPQLRFYYTVPWGQRNKLVYEVRRRLTNLGFVDCLRDLHLWAARAAKGNTAIVICGPSDLLEQMQDTVRDAGEPMAMGSVAVPETAEQKADRRALLHALLSAAREREDSFPGIVRRPKTPPMNPHQRAIVEHQQMVAERAFKAITLPRQRPKSSPVGPWWGPKVFTGTI